MKILISLALALLTIADRNTFLYQNSDLCSGLVSCPNCKRKLYVQCSLWNTSTMTCKCGKEIHVLGRDFDVIVMKWPD